MFRIVPYKPASQSAKLLASKLTALVGQEVVSGQPSYDHRNILWGQSGIVMKTMQPNAAIQIAANKLTTLHKLGDAGISIPEYTTSAARAAEWIAQGKTVLARKLLNGSEGRGIVVCKTRAQLDAAAPAPLYVLLIPKEQEFRVHVMNGAAIDLQEKRRRNGVRAADGGKIDGTIRNIGNDWVFCRNNIREPRGLREIGVAAVKAVGLLFGAVDVIYNRTRDQLYVLEVNTAPGLCDSTAQKYAEAFVALPRFGW